LLERVNYDAHLSAELGLRQVDVIKGTRGTSLRQLGHARSAYTLSAIYRRYAAPILSAIGPVVTKSAEPAIMSSALVLMAEEVIRMSHW